MRRMQALKNFLKLFYKDIKKDYKNQRKEVNLFMIVLTYCITILINKSKLRGTIYSFF